MPDATITSTASTFGTITGTFAADQSTITGTVTGVVVGTLDGSVGVPGIGVPDGGTTGQVLKKASNTSYDTVWGTDLASAAWGTITGTLSSQTDLNTALGLKYDASNPSGFIDAAYLTTNNYATQSWVTGQNYITAAALSPYAPLSGASFSGLIVTAASSTSVAGFKLTLGSTPTSPVNGSMWATSSNVYFRINDISETFAFQSWVTSQLGSYLTTATAASTYQTQAGMSSYLTSATAASTYQTLSGMSSYLTTSAAATTYAPLASPTFTGTVTIPAGASISGYATTASLSSYAPLASPALTGTPTSTTAAADTNTTQIATTAYVVGQASSTAPVVDGTATVGTSLKYARADHVHPTDTSRAALASPTFTGTPAAPTAAVDTNTTQIATTAYVVGQGYAKLASPTFSGTPSLPTGTIAVTQTAGNNTTAVATTAFVQAALPVAATETQALAGTSSTTTISPLVMRHILSNAGYTAHTSLVGNYSSYVSGSASVATLWSNFVGLSVTAANGKVAFLPNSSVSYFPFTSRGKAELNLDWTKPIWFSFRFNYSAAGTIGDANTVNRVTIGKVTSVFGNLASKGFGVTWTAGTTGAFTVSAHNGTTLTSSASAVTVSNTTYFPSTSSAADFLVYSDGTGNITLYCNGVQVATTTGGPSSGNLVGGRFTFEADNTTSTSGNVALDFTGIRSMYSY